MSDSGRAQARHWGRHAGSYEELFLDPFREGVRNPILEALDRIERPEEKTVADLGCGTGPLLTRLVPRFGEVVALDFSRAMIERAKRRLGEDAGRVRFLIRPMSQLEDLAGAIDVAVAINSLVMPDVREVGLALRRIRESLRPGGILLGVVPAIDAIQYQTMLLVDHFLDQGMEPEQAEHRAAEEAEHKHYDFAFGQFRFRGLRQNFWHRFEVQYRLEKAGFRDVDIDRVLYPWDEDLPGGAAFARQPNSWDWTFVARP